MSSNFSSLLIFFIYSNLAIIYLGSKESVQTLIAVSRGKDFFHVKSVDIDNNYISLQSYYSTPVSCYDIHPLTGEILVSTNLKSAILSLQSFTSITSQYIMGAKFCKFSPNGCHFALIGAQTEGGDCLVIYCIETLKVVAQLPLVVGKDVPIIKFSPTSSTVCVMHGQQIKTWNMPDLSGYKTFPDCKIETLKTAAILSDSILFGSSATTDVIYVIDLTSGDRVHVITDNVGVSLSLSLSIDLSVLISMNPKDIAFYDTATYQLLKQITFGVAVIYLQFISFSQMYCKYDDDLIEVDVMSGEKCVLTKGIFKDSEFGFMKSSKIGPSNLQDDLNEPKQPLLSKQLENIRPKSMNETIGEVGRLSQAIQAIENLQIGSHFDAILFPYQIVFRPQ